MDIKYLLFSIPAGVVEADVVEDYLYALLAAALEVIAAVRACRVGSRVVRGGQHATLAGVAVEDGVARRC